ncbi:Rnf-Nqr domain containing protein [Shigella flexneri]
MTHYLLLLCRYCLVNRFELVKFLGLCPFMGSPKNWRRQWGWGGDDVRHDAGLHLRMADRYLDFARFDMLHLRTLSFIPVIAVVVQFTEMVGVRPALPGIVCWVFLPLITTYCAVLGVAH